MLRLSGLQAETESAFWGDRCPVSASEQFGCRTDRQHHTKTPAGDASPSVSLHAWARFFVLHNCNEKAQGAQAVPLLCVTTPEDVIAFSLLYSGGTPQTKRSFFLRQFSEPKGVRGGWFLTERMFAVGIGLSTVHSTGAHGFSVLTVCNRRQRLASG